ncbi:galactan 5-O-arabinofuranosyltransferase [Actinopolyspora alba]|uniref:Galactan 5-O-arabinofuranosyltransferase n=2 Tax=Actinopolyspora alba TaxID=673379 RepID=A0A1I1V5U5_9ACTN|nr:galactan 5-O-arabinofuranosyltransferase [Actinopolyspora alba]
MPSSSSIGTYNTKRSSPDSMPRLSGGRTVLELSLSTGIAVVLSLLLQFLIVQPGISEPGNAPEALAVLGSTLLLLLLLVPPALGKRIGNGGLRLIGVWTALTTLTTLLLAMPLQRTRFYYGGASVDNGFRLQYMNRMAENLVPADMNYADIAPYYPWGWFWLGGRFANLIGWEGWAAYKPYALMWLAVVVVLAFTLWSLVIPREQALLAALVTMLTGMRHGLMEPYAWPSAALLAPIAVLTWYALSTRERAPRGVLLGVGIFVGLTAMTYTLNFGFAVLVTVVMAAVIGATRVARGAAVGRTVWELFLRLVPIGVVSGLLALVVWAPFLLAGGLSESSAAQHYLPAGSAYLPLPFTEFSTFGLLCLCGLVWLILRATSSSLAAALLTVTVTVYVWFGLSTLALVAETTLLAFRLRMILECVLVVAGVIGLVELLHRLRGRVPGRYLPRLTALSVVLAVTGALSVAQYQLNTGLDSRVREAYEDYYPTGHNAYGARNPDEPNAWLDELISTISGMTGRNPQRNVVLSTNYKLKSFEPYWMFQQETPHYANPLGKYEQRAEEIERWADATDSAELARLLRDSPFRAPDVFVLRHRQEAGGPSNDDDTAEDSNPPVGKLSLTLKRDVFPAQPNVLNYRVLFDAALFRGPEFTTREVGPYTVVVR